jgi:hypothetical protein
MPSAASAVRAELAGILAGLEVDGLGVAVSAYVPDVITPPLVVLSTGDPYLTPDDTFNGRTLAAALELYVIAGTGTSEVELDALEQLLEGVAAALPAEFVSASAPFLAPIGGLVYLTSRVKLTTLYTLSKGQP